MNVAKRVTGIATGVSMLFLSACAVPQSKEELMGNIQSAANTAKGLVTAENLGMLAGGGLGGIIFNKVTDGSTFGTIAGTLGGAAAGRGAGGLLKGLMGETKDDATVLAEATNQALETGATVPWKNNDTGSFGAVTVGPEFKGKTTGLPCRTLEQTATVDGHNDSFKGTACKGLHGQPGWSFAQ